MRTTVIWALFITTGLAADPAVRPYSSPLRELKGPQASHLVLSPLYPGLPAIGTATRTWCLTVQGIPNGDLLLVDLDGDGTLQPGRDGMTWRALGRIVPFNPDLPLPGGQVRGLTLDATKGRLSGVIEPCPDISPACYAAVFRLNQVRNAHGLGFLSLDPDLSRACNAHAAYALANGTQGMALHGEDPGRPGFSAAGKAAAAGSSIYPAQSDLWLSMDGWLRSSWHAWPLIDPATTVCGVTDRDNLCMFYRRPDGVPAGGMPELRFPGDDARGVPLSFNVGEIPDPWPGRDVSQCGHPVMWRPPKVRAGQTIELWTGPAARQVRIDGLFSSPSKPANPAWSGNSGLNVFVPAARLAPATVYTVRLLDQGQLVHEYRFTTSTASGYAGR
jgi:hypothetical protein